MTSTQGSERKRLLRPRAYKFRLYPNKTQETLMAKTIGCSRFVYNHFLNLWNETYKKTGKGLSYSACSAMLPKMKREKATHWLTEVDSIALQSSLKDLTDAFSRFFKKQNKKPTFIPFKVTRLNSRITILPSSVTVLSYLS